MKVKLNTAPKISKISINKTSLILLYLLTLTIILKVGVMSLSHATISQSECVQFDNTQKMGPTRDQRTNGLCWAFAGTALMEEEMCFQNPSLCGKSLSPLDASRCEWSLGKQNEGGLTRYAVNCALQNGICLEKDAPYAKKADMNLSCTKQKAEDISPCADTQTQQAYQDFLAQQQLQIKPNTNTSCLTISDPSSLMSFMVPNMKATKGLTCTEKDHTLSAEALFMKNTLIPKTCQNNRFKVQGADQLKGVHKTFPGGHENPDKTPVSEKYKMMSKIMKSNNRSVALSVCLNKVSPELSKIYGTSDSSCSGHAVVAAGSRWKNGKCEIFVKNSWGDVEAESPIAGQMQGWVDAENVLKATYELEYIKR